MIAHRKGILIVFLATLWAVCLYRAITQSLVHDEVLTYQLYLSGPVSQMFDSFNANHHFLNTLLMKISIGLFDRSAWAFRLPALAGAALYFTAVYRISTKEFHTAPASFSAAALLSLNPIVLDFMVAARGYGLGLGFSLWALAVLLPFVRKPSASLPRELVSAGAALALSVTANLIFAIPVAVMTVLVFAAIRRIPPTPKAWPQTSFWYYVMLPAASIGLLFLMTAPVTKATTENFYVGESQISASVRSLIAVSLAHGGPWADAVLAIPFVEALAAGLACAIMFASIAVGIRRGLPLLWLPAATAVGSALMLILTHLIWKLPYPMDRTGIYFFVFMPLALVGLAELFSRVSQGLAYGLPLILIIMFAAQFDTRRFYVWTYDADTSRIADWISQHTANRSEAFAVGGSWVVEPALNFYREENRIIWMRPFYRSQAPKPGFDYYVFIRSDEPWVSRLGLKVVYEGSASGTILAIPAQ